MKRFIALLLVFLFMFGTALAEVDLSQYSVTNASVKAVHDMDITAPCAGTILPYSVESGDQVSAGDLLFSMLTVDVYAPEDGVITALFVEKGDDAFAAMNRYGCLGAMDPAVSQIMSCSIAGAYDNDENKTLHVGETLYFKSNKSNGDKGTGRVTAVTSSGYTLEILTGSFSAGDNMNLYRKDNYENRECVGKGVVAQRTPVTFSSTGVVTDVYVHAGDQVKVGDRILSVLAGTNERNTTPDITASGSGVIGSIAVVPGQQVWKGALLCRMYLTDELEVVADVDEMDLKGLDTDSQVYITLDTDKNNVISGKITQISSLGTIRGNAAYYTVHVSMPRISDVRIGQSASLYLPKN